LHYSRIFIAANWVTAFGMIIIMRLAVNMIKSRSAKWCLPAAIIADADTATDTLYALASDNGMGLGAQAIFLRNKRPETNDREEVRAGYRALDVLTDKANYEDYILHHPEFFYIISLEGIQGERRERLLKLFHENNIRSALIPSITRAGTSQSEPHY